MSNIIYLVIGIVVGYFVGKVFGGARKTSVLVREQSEEKEKNLEAILGLLETNTPLTNNHIEQMLGIPESTATRYMDELEKQGKVRQVGTTGRDVFYEKM